MSNQNDFNHIGEDIRQALDDALRTLDFTKFNETISDTVNGAFDEVRWQIDKATSEFLGGSKLNYREIKSPEEEEQRTSRAQSGQKIYADRTKESFYDKRKVPMEVRKQEIKVRPVGKVSSVLYTVFGGIGTGVTGILSIVFGLMALISGGAFGVLGFGISMLILAVSLGLLGTGSVQRNRLNRFRRYMKLVGSKTYYDIRQLAAQVGKSSKYVIKDLKRMIGRGMLPEGHLDDQGTCLMLDDKTYKQYLETKQAYGAGGVAAGAVRTANEAERMNGGTAGQKQQAQNAPNSENQALMAMISEGQEYIKKFRDLNDRIPGEVISEKLYRLERVITEIFDALKAQPEKKLKMRKFMDYYLPTTLKLVQTYADFDGVQIQGENIIGAKQEIEKTLDTINAAFEKLLDDLFMDAAFDAATDAQVLQTLLAQEGLAEDEKFKMAGKMGEEKQGGKSSAPDSSRIFPSEKQGGLDNEQ